MSSPGNQHCASCIGTLSFPIAVWFFVCDIGPSQCVLSTWKLSRGIGPAVWIYGLAQQFPDARLGNALLKDEESARDNHVLASNFAKYSPIYKQKIAGWLSNKLFLIWLLIPATHLKRVAIIYLADINVSQGSVATYARSGGIF